MLQEPRRTPSEKNVSAVNFKLAFIYSVPLFFQRWIYDWELFMVGAGSDGFLRERLCSSSPPGVGLHPKAVQPTVRPSQPHSVAEECSKIKSLFDERVAEVDLTTIVFSKFCSQYNHLTKAIRENNSLKAVKIWRKYLTHSQFTELESLAQTRRDFKVEYFDESNKIIGMIQELGKSSESKGDFSGYAFSDIAIKKLKSAFKLNSCLKTIILSNSLLSDEQRKSLSEIRADLKSTRHIVIRDSEGGFIDDYQNDYELWDSKYCAGEPPEGIDDPDQRYQPRKTPRAGIELYKLEHKQLPQSIMEVGTGGGVNAIGYLLLGIERVVLVDCNDECRKTFFRNLKRVISERGSGSDGEIPISFADRTIEENKIEEIKTIVLNHWTPPGTVKRLTVTYMAELFSQCNIEIQFQISTSNYVWSERHPRDFDPFMKKFVQTVGLHDFIAGELYGSPEDRTPAIGVTYHTPFTALGVFQALKCQVLYFQIEPKEDSLKRKDADKVLWGELYRIVARRVPSVYDEMAKKISDILDEKRATGQPQIYIDPTFEDSSYFQAMICSEQQRLKGEEVKREGSG